MIGFFLVDQALCVYIHAFTPSKKFPLKETLTHVVWGFLNTKTYTLVVLLHMMNAGVTIPIWLWALDAYFQVDQTKFLIICEGNANCRQPPLLLYNSSDLSHLQVVVQH